MVVMGEMVQFLLFDGNLALWCSVGILGCWLSFGGFCGLNSA